MKSIAGRRQRIQFLCFLLVYIDRLHFSTGRRWRISSYFFFLTTNTCKVCLPDDNISECQCWHVAFSKNAVGYVDGWHLLMLNGCNFPIVDLNKLHFSNCWHSEATLFKPVDTVHSVDTVNVQICCTFHHATENRDYFH